MRSNECFFEVLCSACWGEDIRSKLATKQVRDIYREFKDHAILGLGARILPIIQKVDEDIYSVWRKDVYRQVVSYQHISDVQGKVLSVLREQGTNSVVLKGTAAAKYYPVPEYRTIGDIDIMVRREEFENACNGLNSHGYSENFEEVNLERHRAFEVNGIVVEVHRRFASLNSVEKAETMDGYILNSIGDDVYLPDAVNGLVILEHISQHMEGRIGLRQIIDWMYFVNAWLDDAKWNDSFGAMVDSIGMTVLAKTVTRMCQKYLGLKKEMHWFSDADELLCDDLMEYVMESGNFGCKRNAASEKTVEKLTAYRNPISLIRHMQKSGLAEWECAKKHHLLKPFAWLWKACNLARRAIAGNVNMGVVSESRQRIRLLQRLGVKENAKGVVTYKNGKMIK